MLMNKCIREGERDWGEGARGRGRGRRKRERGRERERVWEGGRGETKRIHLRMEVPILYFLLSTLIIYHFCNLSSN